MHQTSSRCTPSHAVNAERRNMSYCDGVHRRYQNNIYVTGRKVGENIEVYWNVDGEKELSDAWTGFIRFIFWMKSHLMDTHGRGGDLRGNKQLLVQTMYGQICGKICLMQRKAKRSKSGLSRNQSSSMSDNWKECSPSNQPTKNSSSQWKPLVESRKFRCQQQCLAKYR